MATNGWLRSTARGGNMTALYDVPRNTWVKLEDGTRFFFDHVDGMYSYCKTEEGQVFHPAAWTEVTIDENTTPDNPH